MKMTYEQKMAAINSLYPVHDWVCIKIDAMMAPLQSKRDAHIAARVDPDNFFSAATCGDGLTPDRLTSARCSDASIMHCCAGAGYICAGRTPSGTRLVWMS